jgi:hypothetical protein
MTDPEDLDGERQYHSSCAEALDQERVSLRAAIESTNADGSADQKAAGAVLSKRLSTLNEAQCPLFFGRLFHDDGTSLHIGRVGISRDNEAVVVDWRAEAAVPYYRATAIDPLGVDRRRHYVFDGCELTGLADENLIDGTGGGLPDPVLVAMAAERRGQMRDIAQTVQAEQDAIIRESPEASVLVEGGPGTGKTAVGLHRAAFIAYQWRRDGAGGRRYATHQGDVLVVGPNERFIDYIHDVLPSLGEREITYRSYGWLPSSPDGPDRGPVSRHAPLLLDDRVAEMFRRWLRERSTPGVTEDLRVSAGSRSILLSAQELLDLRASSLEVRGSYADRRNHFRTLVRRTAEARNLSQAGLTWSKSANAVVNSAMPALAPKTLLSRFLGGRPEVWSHGEDLFHDAERAEIVALAPAGTYELRVVWDEIDSLMRKTPRQFDHIVADEVQDLSAMELRMLARRLRKGGSISILGDRAQTTSPCSAWERIPEILDISLDYRSLSVGYRVPEEIMSVANALLDASNVGGVRTRAVPGRAGRVDAFASISDWVGKSRVEDAVPTSSVCLLGAGLAHADRGTVAAHAKQQGVDLVLDATEAKGLEFDLVVYVDNWSTLTTESDPTRIPEAFVAITRAVRHLVAVSADGLPGWLSTRASHHDTAL